MKNVCEKCGTVLIDGVCPNCVQRETKTEKGGDNRFQKIFMSPNEKMVAVLGNSYIENFFQNGSLSKGFAVISDKRAYFQGNNYYISHDAKGRKKVTKNQQSRTVDLKDITGTGTDSFSHIHWIILGTVSFILGALGLVMMF